MFVQPLNVVGCIDSGTQLADPADDSQLLAESEEHYWVEFDTGSGFQAADPDFAGATLGQTFTTADTNFTVVPDALHQKVEVQLQAEITGGTQGALGLASTPTTVLDQTYNTVDLVGRSLSIGNFVSTSAIGSAAFSLETITYTPYVAINNDEGSPADSAVTTGTNYQEVLTNLSFANQILTGLFLDVTTITPMPGGQVSTQTVEKTLADRIGFAARHSDNGVALNLGRPPSRSSRTRTSRHSRSLPRPFPSNSSRTSSAISTPSQRRSAPS